MHGISLDTARHACVWYVEHILVLKREKKKHTIHIVISADHENMLVFAHLHHLNEFH